MATQTYFSIWQFFLADAIMSSAEVDILRILKVCNYTNTYSYRHNNIYMHIHYYTWIWSPEKSW